MWSHQLPRLPLQCCELELELHRGPFVPCVDWCSFETAQAQHVSNRTASLLWGLLLFLYCPAQEIEGFPVILANHRAHLIFSFSSPSSSSPSDWLLSPLEKTSFGLSTCLSPVFRCGGSGHIVGLTSIWRLFSLVILI